MKKKVLAVASMMSLAVCIGCPAVYAEEGAIDLSSYTMGQISELKNKLDTFTLEQLVDLSNQIDTLIKEMGGETSTDNTIGEGLYEVGVDIAPGFYSVSRARTDVSGIINLVTFQTREYYEKAIAAYENDEESGDMYAVSSSIGYYSFEEPSEGQESVTLQLKEGNILLIDGEEAIIESISKPSWAM